MAVPHQRTRSGKLVQSKSKSIKNTTPYQEAVEKLIYTGIENATEIEIDEELDYEEIISTYYQSPSKLCDLEIKYLNRMVLGFKLPIEDSIDRIWRNIWNIGTWHIEDKITFSLCLKQPIIALPMVNIKNSSIADIEDIIKEYTSLNLDKSTCTVTGNNSSSQIKGRWGLHVADTAIKNNIVKETDYDIVLLNICHSRFFIWMVLATGSTYLCFLTRVSIEYIMRNTSDDVHWFQEPNNISRIKMVLKNPKSSNDSSGISITDTGYFYYNGKPENLEIICSHLYSAIYKTINSIFLKSFLDSLEYKIYEIE